MSWVEELDEANRTIAALRTRLSEANRLNERLTAATTPMIITLSQIKLMANNETLPANVRLGRIITLVQQSEQGQ